MKIVFMGTPNFSAVVLEKLNSVYPVCAVVTALDKPSGRGNKMQAPALKVEAEKLGIPVLQYQSVSREGIEDIMRLAPDVIVTAAFGQILSEKFLSIPKYGVLNVHASLLPKYRGSSPIQHAILNGDKQTGITVMRTVKAVDAGDILLDARVDIGEKETAGELSDRLAVLGGEVIRQAIYLIESGQAVFMPQDESLATHCSMISKSDGLIDFNRTPTEIDCHVRGMNPWPSAYTRLDGKTLKVFEIENVDDTDGFLRISSEFINSANAEKVEAHAVGKTGVVVVANTKRGLIVNVGKDKFVRLKEIQLEGARRMSDLEFLRGRSIEIGTVLGK